MRRCFYSVVLALVTLSPAYSGENFSLTFDGQYSRRLSGDIGHNNSLGFSALVEWQPADILSLGLDMGMNDYFGVTNPGSSYASSLDIMGRVMPWGIRGDWSPYLLGSIGFDPRIHPSGAAWQGNFHALAGLGTRFFIADQCALDFGALYDFYTPMAGPLQNLSARFGISFYFNPVNQGSPSFSSSPAVPAKLAVTAGPAPKPKAAPPVRNATKKKPSVTIQVNNLWDLAAREDIYGDPELYPLLVDANITKLQPPAGGNGIRLSPGAKLFVPRNLTEQKIKQARKDAWKEAYTTWRGKQVTRGDYLEWKKEQASKRAKVPKPRAKRP